MASTDETPLTIEELVGARAATEQILDGLGITNYRFDVEPAPAAFDVFVEHERDGAWHTVRFQEDAHVLLARDPAVRARIAARWRERLFPAAP
jgi:hypothetical protein